MRIWRVTALTALVVAGFAACTEDENRDAVAPRDGGLETSVIVSPADSGSSDGSTDADGGPAADGSTDAGADALALPQAATPTLLTGGPDLYPCTRKIGLVSATSNAEIFYTVDFTNDGPDPTPSSTRYAGLFIVPENATVAIRARAYAAGFAPSTVAVHYVTYLTMVGALAPVVHAPPSGTFDAAIPLTLSTPPAEGSFICFTVDGGTPACGSSCCGGPCPPTCSGGVLYAGQPITIDPLVDGGSTSVAALACMYFFGSVRSTNVITQTYSF